MVTIEEKLRLFSKLVYQDIIYESEEKIKEIEAKNNILVEEYKKELEEKAKKVIQNMDLKIEQKKNEMISKANMEAKQKLLSKKQELLELLIEEQKSKAKAFVNTREYDLYFKNNFEEILNELKAFKGIRIEVLPQDREKFHTFIEKSMEDRGISTDKICYVEGNKTMIGGMIVSNEEGSIRYDASIASLLEDKRPFIMKRMYEELEKVGDGVGK